MFNKLNIELTNKCNKNCWICGRREREKLYPDLYNKDIDFDLLYLIKKQIEGDRRLLQFHNNGEPLLYPRFGEALDLFHDHIRCFDTNGILLVEKQNEIIHRCEVITISLIENDPTWNKQLDILKTFINIKQDKPPMIVLRYVGTIEDDRQKEYKKLNLQMCYRQLHAPKGSFQYQKECIKPEYIICDEILNHPAINVNGDFSICVRFDPEGKGVLGNIKNQTVRQMWDGEKRKKFLQCHITGNRYGSPLCAGCDFYGIPSG